MGDRDKTGRRVAFELKRGVIAGIAFGDPSLPPQILFLHATGLNALTYRHLLEPLGERFHVVGVDLRGHGRTTLSKGTFGYASWNRHRDDVIELLSRHFPAAPTLAGHSMGGTVSLLVAGRRADLVRGACLLDPVILPPMAVLQYQFPGAPLFWGLLSPIARGAARRRANFASKAEALQALTGRGFFKTWPQEVLADYVEDGFVETKRGVTLACPRSYEARTFAAHRHDPWRAIARAAGPISILRAGIRSTTSDAAAHKIAIKRPDIRLAVVEGATHALPMERPDRVRAAIESTTLLAGGKNRFA
jgi:pimeloyl-ACP methyl ester carboxylesterase